MTGDVDQLMRAVALVVTKLSENPDYHLLTVGGSARAGRPWPDLGGPVESALEWAPRVPSIRALSSMVWPSLALA